MIFQITTSSGEEVRLQPSMELYRVKDFMGKKLPSLAIVLNEVGHNGEIQEQYAVLTISFGEFIGIKNCAYIDTNNCRFAEQLLDYGIATPTGLTKESGSCSYPLWHFEETFLKEIGGEYYEKYSNTYEAYIQSSRLEMSREEEKANAFVERLKQEYDALRKQIEAYSKEDIIEKAIWINALQKNGKYLRKYVFAQEEVNLLSKHKYPLKQLVKATCRLLYSAEHYAIVVKDGINTAYHSCSHREGMARQTVESLQQKCFAAIDIEYHQAIEEFKQFNRKELLRNVENIAVIHAAHGAIKNFSLDDYEIVQLSALKHPFQEILKYIEDTELGEHDWEGVTEMAVESSCTFIEKAEVNKRKKHYLSYVGTYLRNPAASLEFHSYNPETNEFTVRHWGGPNSYIEDHGTPEEIAKNYHFSMKVKKHFFDMNFIIQSDKKEIQHSNTKPAVSKKKRER